MFVRAAISLYPQSAWKCRVVRRTVVLTMVGGVAGGQIPNLYSMPQIVPPWRVLSCKMEMENRSPRANPLPQAGVLSTRRLRLEPIRPDDLDAMHGIVNETSVRRFLFDNQSMSRERVRSMLSASERQFRANGTGIWALRTHASERLIGFFCLWPLVVKREKELGFALASVHWGNGYATEAGSALIDYVREHLGWEQLKASTDLCNNRSILTLWRLDFVESALIRGPVGPLREFKRRP
jgi:ribosomal-protein-alanine N-acetyltransferase